MDPITIATMGAQLLEMLIGAFTKAKAPQAVIDGLTAAAAAIQTHQTDLITKANLEAQRG